MPEVALVAIGLVAAGLIVLAPLRRDAPDAGPQPDDALALRHRVALEALRDVEADRRAGSLDEPGYVAQRAEAEARAAATLTALESSSPPPETTGRPRRRFAAAAAAALIGVALVVGSALPATGLPNATVINETLAAAEAAETARQDEIADLLADLDADPRDPSTLSALADAYLAGSSPEDLQRGAVALQALIALDPGRADAYERIMAAYLRAGDAANARLAHDAYAELEGADPVELAFFDGLIALRGEEDRARANAAFDRFLELAPNDPRAPMVRGLREGG